MCKKKKKKTNITVAVLNYTEHVIFCYYKLSGYVKALEFVRIMYQHFLILICYIYMFDIKQMLPFYDKKLYLLYYINMTLITSHFLIL